MEKQHNKLLLALLAFSPLAALAAPVGPQQAARSAVDFRASQVSSQARRLPAAGELTLAYTAQTDAGSCYYVFNAPGNGGYTIVSADDRLPAVIGYSESGSFDLDRMPDNMRWWLEGYTSQISRFLEEDPKVERYVQRARPSDYAVIEPLCKTLWDQGAPYNNDCPYDSWGRARSVTGCVATAMAQLMKYHNFPEKPTGMRNGFKFEGTTLSWDDMLDDYSGNYTATQAAAVAQLMRQCGASVDMMYSSYASGAFDWDVPVALRTYFGYNPGLEIQYREYYTYSEWNKMVYDELSNNGPVFYCGRSDRGGHAFICDGYAGKNFYHFNWGWGGYQDGYFLLNALNPATGGAGSFAGGYNSNQSIVTGVYPSKGDQPIQTMAQTTGGFAYKGGKFVIEGDPDGLNLLYNPLAYPFTAEYGIKVMKADGTGEPKYASAGTQTFSHGYGLSSLSVAVPKVADGEYHVTPAMKAQGEGWKDVLVPLEFQTYVGMSVTGGVQKFDNPGPAGAGQSQLVASLPLQPEKAYATTGHAVKTYVTNVGSADYTGVVYLTVMDADDPFGNIMDAEIWTIVPAGLTSELEFTSDSPLGPGNYAVYVMDSEGNDLLNDVYITVEPSDFQKPNENLNILVRDFEPRFYTIDPAGCGVNFEMKNRTAADQTVKLTIEIMDANTLKTVKTLTSGEIKVAKNSSEFMGFAGVDLGVAPGEYFWRVLDQEGNQVSMVVPLLVQSPVREENGIFYVETSQAAKRARVVEAQGSDYAGNVVIPAAVGGLEVASVLPTAFTYSEDLTSISLPASIKHLDGASFYYASALEAIRLGSPEPVMVNPLAFAPGAQERIVVSMPKGSANLYARTDSWMDFLISNWTIEEGNGAKLLTQLAIDPETSMPYSPYYLSAEEELELEVALTDGKNTKAEWTFANGEAMSRVYDGGKVTLPCLNGESAVVVLSSTNEDSSVALLPEGQQKADVISIDGRVVLRNADADAIRRLPRGLYIVAGRKVVL